MYSEPNKFLVIALVTSVLSYMYSLLIIFLYKNLGGADKALNKTQSVHVTSTPRLGGLALILAIISVEAIFGGLFRIWFLLAVSPIFIVGMMEDFHFETKPVSRLTIGAISSLLAIYLSNSWITTLDFPFLDKVLEITPFGILFTVFASVGMINAINLIDGVHGFAAAKTVLISMGIFLVASKVGENGIAAMAALVAAASLGLFFVSFPYGRIFMGDAGAYTIGFVLAWQMITLLNRHSDLSAWSLLAIVFWPVMDTLFAIYRRMRKGASSSRPDLLHFHQLIMRFWEIASRRKIPRTVSNPLATATILPLSFFPIIMGIKFSHDVKVGFMIVVSSAILYLLGYYSCFLILKKKKLRSVLFHLAQPVLEKFLFTNSKKQKA